VRTPSDIALIFSSGGYRWGLACVGIFAIVVGGALAFDFKGTATVFTARRARWGFLGGPLWFWRAWGAFVALCGLMLVLQ
jgi:hypothetical protein